MRAGVSFRWVALITGLLAGLGLLGAQPASAHVEKDVGAYHFVVGWGTEPAYAGQLNSVQLVLTDRRTGKPVLDLGSGFRVTVVYGSQKLSLALEPTFDPDTGFGTPGDYRAWLIPTAPGDYTLRFSGKIGMQNVDQSFTSGPTTFATVESPTSVQFPVRAPSTADLSQRLDAQLPRLATSSDMSSARTLGVVSIVIGIVALALAGLAYARRKA
jgi:hypothetical protein